MNDLHDHFVCADNKNIFEFINISTLLLYVKE